MALSWVKGLLLQIDLFWSTDYFRYRSEPQYRTLTGGVCSLFLIIIIAVVFSSSVISTLSKQNINWQYSVAQQTDTEFSVTVDTHAPAKFMFAVGVNEMDLVTAPRYFDFSLTQENNVGGVLSTVEFKLQPCRRENWEGAGESILKIFDRKNFSSHLCPMAGESFSVTGMSTSSSYKHLKLSVLQCDPNSTLAQLSPCADTSVLNDFLTTHANFILHFYFVNALINPSNPTEITYYLEDRNYVPFNFVYGGEVNLYMSRYSIITDEQILPYEDTRMSKGGIVNSVGQYVPSRKFGRVFSSINVKKSALSMDLIRNYTKLDSTLSYVGGLFGFLMVFFVFMRVYTQYSYEVEMADRLYSYDRNDPLKSDGFHFGTFMGYVLFRVGKWFGEVKWPSMRKYHECREEIQKQFDVCFLMRRVIFLERSLRVVLEDHQFKGLHMHEKMTLKEARQLRKFYKLRDRIREQEGGGGSADGAVEDEEDSSHQSDAMNVTDDLLENNEAVMAVRDDSSGLEAELKESGSSRSRKASKKRRLPPNEVSLSDKNKSMLNDSQAILRPPSSLRGNSILKQSLSPSPPSSHALKLLQKDSLSGNRVSRRIYEGFSTDLLKKILLRIEEDHEDHEDQEDPTEKIVVEEREEEFEIRISKRRVRPREERAEEEEGEGDGSNRQRLGMNLKQEREQGASGFGLVVQTVKMEPNSPLEIEMQRSHTNQVANEFEYIH